MGFAACGTLKRLTFEAGDTICPDCGHEMFFFGFEQAHEFYKRAGLPDSMFTADKRTLRDKKKATFDHILPRSYGGPNTIENGRIVCKECNEARGCGPVPNPAIPADPGKGETK